MQSLLIPVCNRLLCLHFTLIVLLMSPPGHAYDRSGVVLRPQVVSLSHHDRLQYVLDAAVGDGLPGVSLRVVGPGIDFTGAAGVADLHNGETLTTGHALYAASIGKAFTASIALQLYAEGRLELDAPITTWLPGALTDRIPSSHKITLRHLHNHSSGLIDYLNDQTVWRSVFARYARRRWRHSDVLPYLYDRPLLFEPGSDYRYSNSNYILVGMIIEQLTDQPLHALVRERILEPVGMKHTVNGNEIMGCETLAHGYASYRGRTIDTCPWYSNYGLADSGLYSTPTDLALFIRSLFNTEMILSEAMRDEMTHVSALGRPPSEYGLGIYVQQNPWGAGLVWYGHDGIDPGYQANMMHLPAHDLTIVLAANASMGRANRVYEKLIRAVVDVALDAAWANKTRRGE